MRPWVGTSGTEVEEDDCVNFKMAMFGLSRAMKIHPKIPLYKYIVELNTRATGQNAL